MNHKGSGSVGHSGCKNEREVDPAYKMFYNQAPESLTTCRPCSLKHITGNNIAKPTGKCLFFNLLGFTVGKQ